MVTPDEEYDQYVKDPRTECKFGASCYQKNPLHHQKYKHPPKKRQSEEQIHEVSKKQKLESLDSSSSKAVPKEPPLQPEKVFTNIPIQDAKTFIKENFLVDMPKDFYLFWEFCKILSNNNPTEAFTSVNLHLVGPYDVLTGKFNNVIKTADEYLLHWRYYYDPPEFQTVLRRSDSEYHIGYFRDVPSAAPVFLVSNNSKKNGRLKCMGENMFAAVWRYLETFKKKCDPFKKVSANKLQNNLRKHAENLELNIDTLTDSIKQRNKKIVARTFNTIGLVVPVNQETEVGYRHLCIHKDDLRKLLDRVGKASAKKRDKLMSELQPVLTAASVATDECDFGTGIELGWNILAHGVDSLNATIATFLSSNYNLLNRDVFAKIITVHMQNRKKGADLSIV